MSVKRANDFDLSIVDLAAIAARFGLGTLESIGGFENALFRSADGRIVRVTHTSRRSVGMVEAEFAFMDHLAGKGVPVVGPIHTTDDRLVAEETTEAGEDVVAVCMTHAPGDRLRGSLWTDENLVTYGELLGAMHAAARDHVPPTSGRRPDWTDAIFDVGIGALEESHPDLYRRNAEIIAAAAVTDAGGTGLLIHQDVHMGNVFVTDDGVITVFDFDDSAYGTPVHDVAIPLFYWVLVMGADAAAPFMRNFLKGYRRHAELPDGWEEDADRFLSYREIDIYWLVASEPDDESSEVELRFMDQRYERILAGVPYLGRPLREII